MILDVKMLLVLWLATFVTVENGNRCLSLATKVMVSNRAQYIQSKGERSTQTNIILTSSPGGAGGEGGDQSSLTVSHLKEHVV